LSITPNFAYLELEAQIILLQTGWQLISSYIEPQSLILDDIFAEQIIPPPMPFGTLDKITDDIPFPFTGEYYPAMGTNTIGLWTNGEGYRVDMVEQDYLTITGKRVPSYSVHMDQLCNWMAYLYSFPMNVETVLHL